MKKESEMIRQKKLAVEKRSELVRETCETCVNDGVKITYSEIEKMTGIPAKTLQRNPYKSDIAYYRDLDNNEKKSDNQTEQLRSQITYLNEVIKQLNKENHVLKTRLYNEDMI